MEPLITSGARKRRQRTDMPDKKTTTNEPGRDSQKQASKATTNKGPKTGSSGGTAKGGGQPGGGQSGGQGD